MFLTKKSIFKIAFLGVMYFIAGSISLAMGVHFNTQGINESPLFVIGVVLYLLCPLFVLWGRYAEGMGGIAKKYIGVLREGLRPAEFIKEYEDLTGSSDLVVCKPGLDALLFVAIAYDCLGEHDMAVSFAKEAIAVAPAKKKARATLSLVSILYSCGRTDEAERLFDEVQKTKIDLSSRALADMIRRADRAMAIGDYKTAISTARAQLEVKFPKPDNLARLALHYDLAVAYEKLGDTENAVTYYRYCAEHGGETAIRSSAKAALERLM